MTEQEFIQKLPMIEQYYVIICDFTKMPYVECDQETFDDKAFVFLDDKKAEQFVEEYKMEKMMLHTETVGRADFLAFATTLVIQGVNVISFRGEEDHDIQLDHIIKRHLKEGAPKPVENPLLQLSMTYFMQAVRTAETQEERIVAKQFEEEMMVNIARGHYLIPSKPVGEPDEEGNQKVVFLQIKNQNGDMYIPLFTDLNEFSKYQKINPNTEPGLRFMVWNFNQIYNMNAKGLTGFIINPGSVSVLLSKQHLNAVHEMFGNQAEE